MLPLPPRRMHCSSLTSPLVLPLMTHSVSLVPIPTPLTLSSQQLHRRPRFGLATQSTSSTFLVFASLLSLLPPSPLSPVSLASIPLPHAPRLPPIVPPPPPLPTLLRVPLPPVRLRLTLSLLSSLHASPSLPSVVALRPCPFARAPVGPALVPPPPPTMMVQVCLAYRLVSVPAPLVPLHDCILVLSLSRSYPRPLVSRPPFPSPPISGYTPSVTLFRARERSVMR